MAMKWKILGNNPVCPSGFKALIAYRDLDADVRISISIAESTAGCQ
jgi:hypothetical protein